MDRPLPSRIVIKPFTLDDWHTLEVIHFAHLAEDGVVLDPATISDCPQPELYGDDYSEWDLENIEKAYLSGAGNFWLAWYADDPAGHVGAQDVRGVIELRRMYVRASHRRRGVGTALVSALIAQARDQGIPAIELWTAMDGSGRQLYQTLGFRKTERPGVEFGDINARTRYVPGVDEIRMRLDL